MTARKRRSRKPAPAKLMITPMIDMFTVILIFLIVSYSPEQARIIKSEHIELPQTELKLSQLPHVQIEVTASYISLNGERLEGGSSDSAWQVLHSKLQEIQEQNTQKSGLIISDKGTPYRFIDQTISRLSAAGFSEVYFLTQEETQ